MTVSTVYGIAGDGWIQSWNATYATARSGSNLSASTADGDNVRSGQSKAGANYLLYEGFVGFDTSVVSTDTVTAAVLSLWLNEDNSTTDNTQQARLQTWSGSGLTTADYVAADSLTQTLLATISSNGIGAAGAYKTFTSEAAFTSNINGSGNTEIILCSDRQAAGTTPTDDEYLRWDDADTAGTSQDPKLVVTHAAVVSANVTGVTATADAAGIAGSVAAQVSKAVTGVTATSTAAGIAGSVAAQVQTAVTGVTATATAAGVAGVVNTVRIAAVTGVTAAATAAGIAGVVAAVGIVNVVGVAATAAAAGIAGIVYAVMTTGGSAGPSVAGTLDTGGSAGPSIAASNTGGTAGPGVAATLDVGGDAGPTIPYSGPW